MQHRPSVHTAHAVPIFNPAIVSAWYELLRGFRPPLDLPTDIYSPLRSGSNRLDYPHESYRGGLAPRTANFRLILPGGPPLHWPVRLSASAHAPSPLCRLPRFRRGCISGEPDRSYACLLFLFLYFFTFTGTQRQSLLWPSFSSRRHRHPWLLRLSQPIFLEGRSFSRYRLARRASHSRRQLSASACGPESAMTLVRMTTLSGLLP